MAENTFLGLQPYTEDDAYRFKGRTEESQELFRLIVRNDFTVCYAESGEGKTSLLNAGVFPLLRENMYFPIAITFTSDDYQVTPDNFSTIIDRCIKDSIAEYNEKNKGVNVEYRLYSTDFQGLDCQTELQQELSKYSWWKLRNYKPQAMGLTFTPVFVFDQFEEVFNMPGSIVWTKKFFDWLEDVSSDSCPDEIVKKIRAIIGTIAAFPAIKEEKDFKAVFSLRKEFIGELDYWGMQKCFIPSLKDNRYCLKALTYEGAKKVMTQQERFDEEKVEQILAHLVRQYSREPEKTIKEQLPIIPALLLSVVCDSWEKDISSFAKLSTDEISQSLNKILEKFYDDTIDAVIKELSHQNASPSDSDSIRKDIDVAMFDLVDVNGKRVRVKAVTTLGTISMKRNKRFSETLPIVKYKQILNQHRIVKITKIDGEDYVEIVHDSLCPIIAKRREMRLAEETKEREKKLKKKNKQLLFGSLFITLLIAILLIILWDGLYHDIEKHYGFVIKRNGWYEGLEEISVSEASFRNCHYVLKYHGRWDDHPYAMEARDGYGKLTIEHDVKNYIVDQYEESDTGVDSIMLEELKTVCQWLFVRNENGDFIVQEQSLNKDGKLIVSNNRALTNDGKVINTYVDDYGFPVMLRDSIYFYVRSSCDNRGYETLIEFYDDQGMPIVNKDSVYQIRKEYLSNGILQSEYGCFFDGRPTMSKNRNSGYRVIKFNEDSIRWAEIAYIDENFDYCKPDNRNSAILKQKYDIHGRMIESGYWDKHGKPTTDTLGIHAWRREYNDHGQVLREYYLNLNGKECPKSDSLVEINFRYDKYGNEIERRDLYIHQVIVYLHEYLENGTCVKSEIFSASRKRDMIPLNVDIIDTTFIFRYYNNISENKELYMYNDHCVRVERDSYGNTTCVSYFDAQNKNPIEYNGYHENRTVYDYQGLNVNYTDSYFNIKGELTNPLDSRYAMLKGRLDSVTRSRSYIEYDKNEKYITGYRDCYDDSKLSHVVSEESINEHWRTIRTYKNNRFYYRSKMLYSIRSHSKVPIGWYAEGELGNPSVFFEDLVTSYAKTDQNNTNLFKDMDLSKSGNIIDTDENMNLFSRLFPLFDIPIQHSYYAMISYKGNPLYFNEHGQRINPQTVEWQIIPYVETLQSGSQLGFQNGDIILACNEWKLNIENLNLIKVPWQKNIRRVFIIARVNNENDAYEKKHIEIPANINIYDYVMFKKMRCTSYEISEIIPLLDSL